MGGGWTTETETETEVDIESGSEARTRTEAGAEGEPHRNMESTSALHRLVREPLACIPVASRKTECTSGAVAMGAAAVSIWKGARLFLLFVGWISVLKYVS